MRTPTQKDKNNADKWLFLALQELESNEYHKVKLLCRQVIRALRRKDSEKRI